MKFSEWQVGRVYKTPESEKLHYKILESGVVRRKKLGKGTSFTYCDNSHNWLVSQSWIEVEIPYTFDEAKADCEKTGQNYWYNHDDEVLKTTIYIMRMFGPVQLHICSEDKQCIIPLNGKWYKYDV